MTRPSASFLLKTALLPLAAAALLAACGRAEDQAANPPTHAAEPVPAAAAVPAPENALGKTVYGKTCAMCHAAGVAGAPKPGDKGDWGPRIAQGIETLHKHALEGFTGDKGMMPARGGGSGLSDDEVKAAVDFMVAQSR
ncbi:cytochrome c5 family protein [Roseateles sp. DAIF2]|uniref:c-type cytochrome n=1 Tax=Roseateles sp. DAIF2 TaxID=2714952 RepID=UPI0018A24F7E|nr:c-type cytochrome [Roseateles sp. DAIF2]QPF74000.1 cytochrome c5 family protein [Roseateles sp. DAIF2]